MRDASAGFSLMQVFTGHNLHFLSNKFQDVTLFEMDEQLKASMPSQRWRGFYFRNLDKPLALDNGTTGLRLKSR